MNARNGPQGAVSQIVAAKRHTQSTAHTDEPGIPYETLTFEQQATLMARMATFGYDEPPEVFWAGMYPYGQQVAWLESFADQARRESRVDLEGAELLDQLSRALTKYVVLPSPEAVTAVVLWIAATHGLDAFDHATRLVIHSPVKRCGKSRLLDIIGDTAHSTIETTNISVPALFRMIDAADRPPTLILDEVDRLLGSAKKDDDNRDLVAILNNGFRAGHPTYRCVGPTQKPTPFSNYAMVALAAIGRITDTVEDRAVNITMRRRLPGETISKYRLATDPPKLHELRDRLAVWVGSVMERLAMPVLDIPDELEDRAEDAWEPLLSVADAAGGHWPKQARTAALKFAREAADDDDSLDTRILADLSIIFTRHADATFISTADLLAELRKLEDAPWADLDLTSRKLAYRVGKFGVKPKSDAAGKVRGYHIGSLRDAFLRYLPFEPSEASKTQGDQPIPSDTSKSSDTSIRQTENIRQSEIAGQTPNLTRQTGQTDTPDRRDQMTEVEALYALNRRFPGATVEPTGTSTNQRRRQT